MAAFSKLFTPPPHLNRPKSTSHNPFTSPSLSTSHAKTKILQKVVLVPLAAATHNFLGNKELETEASSETQTQPPNQGNALKSHAEGFLYFDMDVSPTKQTENELVDFSQKKGKNFLLKLFQCNESTGKKGKTKKAKRDILIEKIIKETIPDSKMKAKRDIWMKHIKSDTPKEKIYIEKEKKFRSRTENKAGPSILKKNNYNNNSAPTAEILDKAGPSILKKNNYNKNSSFLHSKFVPSLPKDSNQSVLEETSDGRFYFDMDVSPTRETENEDPNGGNTNSVLAKSAKGRSRSPKSGFRLRNLLSNKKSAAPKEHQGQDFVPKYIKKESKQDPCVLAGFKKISEETPRLGSNTYESYDRVDGDIDFWGDEMITENETQDLANNTDDSETKEPKNEDCQLQG